MSLANWTKRKSEAQPSPEEVAREAERAFRQRQTPYAGSINGVPVETAPHVIVSGPTGRGKSTRVLTIGALQWRGPKVLVSSKTDFMKWVVTKGIADRGPLYVMDLAGELDDSFDWLQNVKYTRVVSDPTALITDDDEALTMASLLMKVGSLGASDGRGGGGGDDAFWQTLAAQPLAALLLAGRASGEGIAWTLRAASKVIRDDDDESRSSPNWANAYQLIAKTSFHAEELLSAGNMEDKLRDSLIATMKSGLAPWLQTTTVRPFAPAMLEGPAEPTLCIISPADGVGAGAAVGAIETIIRHWRRGVERGLDRVLLAIDEFCNVAPVPLIDRYLSEARGLGVACLLAIQSSLQLYDRFGESKGKVIREVAPAFLVLEGAAEFDQLELASKWTGEHDVWRETIDAQQNRSISAERAPVRSVSELLPKNVEEGRLLLYGQEGKLVELPGIWQYA